MFASVYGNEGNDEVVASEVSLHSQCLQSAPVEQFSGQMLNDNPLSVTKYLFLRHRRSGDTGFSRSCYTAIQPPGHHSHYKLSKRPRQDIHTPPWYRRHILRVPISPHASYSPRRFAISNNLSRLHGGRTPAVGHLCLSYSFYPNGYVGSGAH